MNIISKKAIVATLAIGGLVAGAITASAALNLPTQNCSFVFNTNMKLGSRGADVKNLQTVLNMFPQTTVSTSGVGSQGNETTYFGNATKAAVNKFQALHLSELGIANPTGNVFSGTRGLLNQVCSGVSNTTTTTTTTTTTGTTVTTSGPVSVTASASQPQQMIVTGQSGALLADFTFTGNGTVTGLQLQRTGISTDTTLTNVYLYDGNTRITDAASVVTGGYINFNASSGLFTVNGSRTISVRADIAANGSGANAGNSVGVKVNTLTTLGGLPSTFTNVQGNQLVLAALATSAVNIAALSQGALTVDAGTTNYNVWSSSVTVSTRAANLKAATFKFVGSAPVDSLANISLFIDGTKVGNSATINPANNNKVTFDLGATPYVLRTGSHTVDVRADIVKGSYRTITMSIENVSDLMIEDSSLAGVNISSTIATAAFTQSAATYGQITVNKGSVTANVDPSFTTTQVTGGATNVPVGQFVLRGYGEDVKVSTLKVTFATTTVTTINNVSLYANGGQIGTSQNFLGTAALTFTLGSSLILPANTSVTLTVKADMVNSSNAAYTTGTVATLIGGVSSNAQGQSSYEAVDVAATAITGNTLTVSSGAGSFAKTSGFTAQTVSPNTSNVKIGSFTIQANSAESIKINSVGVKPTPTGSNGSVANAITNYSSLTLKTGSRVLGTPVGNPASGTSTFSFNDEVVNANGTMTFDVYANVGSAASTTDNPIVTTGMAVTYRGSVSNITTVSAAAGVAITSSAATLAAPTLLSTSNVAQYVVGGSTFGMATFKLSTAAAGTVANVNKLSFTTTGTDAIESITVGGITVPVTGSGAGATTTVTGLNISVPYTGVSVPVTVKFSGFQGSATGGSLLASIATVKITLGHVEGTSGSGSGTITNTTVVDSNTMSLVASKPTVTVGSGSTGAFIGQTVKIGEFTVSADANGPIAIASTSIDISTLGVTAPELATSTLALKDGGSTISGVGLVINASATASTSPVFTFTTPYEIAAGTTKTFSIYGRVNGSATASMNPSVSVNLTSAATFKWNDVLGGSTGIALDGTKIYNFPTNSYSLRTQ